MIVTIECDSPNVVFGNSSQPVKVEVSLTKDGVNGLSAYEIAVRYGYDGTEEDFAKTLISNFNQEVISNCNGIILDFPLLHNVKPNTEKVYLNGQKLSRTQDYSINSNIITFNEAPFSGDIIEIEYKY